MTTSPPEDLSLLSLADLEARRIQTYAEHSAVYDRYRNLGYELERRYLEDGLRKAGQQDWQFRLEGIYNSGVEGYLTATKGSPPTDLPRNAFHVDWDEHRTKTITWREYSFYLWYDTDAAKTNMRFHISWRCDKLRETPQSTHVTWVKALFDEFDIPIDVTGLKDGQAETVAKLEDYRRSVAAMEALS